MMLNISESCSWMEDWDDVKDVNEREDDVVFKLYGGLVDVSIG